MTSMITPFISKISLRNFKCYEHLDLELQPGVNLFYGVNGTGKTSILEGINIAAGSFFMKLSSVDNRDIKRTDIRLESKNGMPSPEYQVPVEIKAEGFVLEKHIKWSRELNTISGGITSINAKEIEKLSLQAASYVQNGELKQLPIIAYFSTQRLFTERKEQRKDAAKNPVGRFSGYYNALNATNTRKHIQAWFKDAEYEQYQKRQTDTTFTNHGLEGIKSLLLKYFEEDWIRIYYYAPESNEQLESGLYIVHKNGNIIPEGLLSDGYRNFLWLLIEIAWRCYILNPFLGQEAAAKTKGIVTIDEVDLHLHPKWQQRIVPILAEAFPNIQFVISTHSPIVLSSVKGNVLRLEGDKVFVQENLYGLKPSQVLEGFMQIQERLPKFMGDIQTYFTLINQEQGKSSEALALREKLEKEISQNDPLFTEADALINFYSY
jgi:predicted ATP-binding protein involved in virulence